MKARYLDLPVEALSHRLFWPELWPLDRGRTIVINPHPIADCESLCEGPFWLVPGEVRPNGAHAAVCVHLIELDESALDAEVEAIAHEVAEQAAACIPDEVLK